MDFAPAQLAPMIAAEEAISSSSCMLMPPSLGRRSDIRSAISLAGVIGYPAKNRHPAAIAPSTQATLPCQKCGPGSTPLIFNPSSPFDVPQFDVTERNKFFRRVGANKCVKTIIYDENSCSAFISRTGVTFADFLRVERYTLASIYVFSVQNVTILFLYWRSIGLMTTSISIGRELWRMFKLWFLYEGQSSRAPFLG